MNTTVRDTLLEISVDDITQLGVDAVVSPENERLTMNEGVAAALRTAGGVELETLAQAQGPIQIGDAVTTPAGRLGAKWVVHAAVAGDQLRADANLVAQATTRALQVADKVGVHSLAIPVLGAGEGGVPLYSATSIMVGRVKAYLEANRRTSLKRVVFCAHDAASRAAFGNAMAGSPRL